MTLASSIILYAFVSHDYSIRYVDRYSDSVQPLFYKLTSYWGGLDGSIMFWVFLLSVFGAIAVKSNRERQRELIPYVVAVIAAVQMFFLFLMIVHKDPFATYLTEAPADGRGLNPLLQNPYMAIHPPSLYTGFVGMTIPFAFGMAALITGYLGRLLASRRASVDDVLLVVSVAGVDPRDDLGLRGAGVGRVLGMGPGRERRGAPVVHRDGLSPFGDGARASKHAPCLERDARHPDVFPDDRRDVHDEEWRRAVGARLRRGPAVDPAVLHLHGVHHPVQLWLGHLPDAASPRPQRPRVLGVARGCVLVE